MHALEPPAETSRPSPVIALAIVLLGQLGFLGASMSDQEGTLVLFVAAFYIVAIVYLHIQLKTLTARLCTIFAVAIGGILRGVVVKSLTAVQALGIGAFFMST